MLGLVLPTFGAASATAQQPTAASIAHQVDRHYNHLHSLQARYTERYQGMGMDRSESGTLTLQKPGRMRWAYDSPAGKLFVLDGHHAISYTPGDAQATRLPAQQVDDLRSPLRFLLGHADLSKEFNHLTLTLVDGGYTLTGAPRVAMGDPSQHIQSLSITVDPTGQIHTMRLEETDGTATTFTFSEEHENIPTRSSDFAFTPPTGVNLVDASRN